jgi:carbamoyl-phosphate synthase large subunit
MSLRIAPERMFITGSESNEYYIQLSCADKNYLVPRANDSGYIDRLNEILLKENIEFVHAQPDVEVSVISTNREKLEAKVFLPSKEAIQICQDKIMSAKKWLKNNVPVANFLELKKESNIEEAFELFGSPIWIRATKGAGGKGSTPAYNKETAIAWIRYWKSRGKEWKFMAQETLPGRNIGFHSLWKDGELVTSMSRERIEYIYPYLAPSGITGTPTVQRTIQDEKVNKVGTEAVLSIDPKYNGIACIDLKENSEDIPCVTEINAGRMFTTSFFFSYTSKILEKNYHANLPYLYVKLAFNEEIPKISKYNLLPQDIYWIRHIDAPGKIVKNGKVIGVMYP